MVTMTVDYDDQQENCKLDEVFPSIITWSYGCLYLLFGVFVGFKAFTRVKIAKHKAIDQSKAPTNKDNIEIPADYNIEVKSQESAVSVSDNIDENNVNKENVKLEEQMAKMYAKHGKIDSFSMIKMWFWDMWDRKKCY